MTETRIRPMGEADIPRLLEIERSSFPAPWTEYMFQCQLRLSDISVNIVLEENGEIIAYCTGWLAADEIHILSIATVPEKRRCGYAGRLIDKVVEQGRERGGTRVILEVRASNESAQKLYGKYGFKVIGVRKGYYAENDEDALIMELKLVDRI